MANQHYDTTGTGAPSARDRRAPPGAYRWPTTIVNPSPAVPTAPVAPRRSGSRRVAIVAAVVVAVTVIRPWGDGASPAPPSPRTPAAVLAASSATGLPDLEPSPAPSLLPDQIACNPGGWTVVSLDRMGSWTVRSWVPAHAVLADGPLDPRVRRLTLESPEVLAIGACAPSTVDGAGATVPGGPVRFVGAWRLDTGQATRVDLGVHRVERLPSVATLYRPAIPSRRPPPRRTGPPACTSSSSRPRAAGATGATGATP